MTSIFAPFRELDLATRPRVAPVSVHAGVAFDAVRTPSALELSFDLPGYAPDDVDVSVDRNVLTVTAERSRTLAEDAALVVGERRHGKVRRQLRLSDSLDLGAIEARFDNGVLSVRVPVAETAQPHKVEIAVGAVPLVEAAVVDTDGDGATSTN